MDFTLSGNVALQSVDITIKIAETSNKGERFIFSTFLPLDKSDSALSYIAGRKRIKETVGGVGKTHLLSNIRGESKHNRKGNLFG